MKEYIEVKDIEVAKFLSEPKQGETTEEMAIYCYQLGWNSAIECVLENAPRVAIEVGVSGADMRG